MSYENIPELEGKVISIKERLPHTIKKSGKETTKQEISLKINATNKIVSVTFWGRPDIKYLLLKHVILKKLSRNTTTNTYSFSEWTSEVEDRLDSSVDDQYDGVDESQMNKIAPETVKQLKQMKIVTDNITPQPKRGEQSKFSISVKRSQDYQSLELSEEFTGSFDEIDSYFYSLKVKAGILLQELVKDK